MDAIRNLPIAVRHASGERYSRHRLRRANFPYLVCSCACWNHHGNANSAYVWDRMGVNIGFTVVSVTFGLIFICCGALITHITLKIFHLRSTIKITLALYTVVIIYSPVTTLLLTSQVYQTFHAIYIMKLVGIEKLTVREIIRQLATPAPFLQREMPLAIIDVLVTWGASVVAMLSTAAFAEFLVQWYGNPRYRTYLAVACSGVGLLILNIAIYIPLNIMLLYTYIEGGK